MAPAVDKATMACASKQCVTLGVGHHQEGPSHWGELCVATSHAILLPLVADHHIQPWVPTAVQPGRLQYREANGMTRYLFCCIDMFSQYAWACPLASHRRTEPASAIAAVLDDMREPSLVVQIAKGTKICTTHFQCQFKSRAIHFFIRENNIKCAVVERFQWHPTGCCILCLSCRPCCAPKTPQCHELCQCEVPPECLRVPRWPWSVPGFRTRWPSPADCVRMSKTRRQFAKGYMGHSYKEIFWVEAMQDMSPMIYVVAIMSGVPIKRNFYRQELQKVMLSDYLDIEAILDTRLCRGG